MMGPSRLVEFDWLALFSASVDWCACTVSPQLITVSCTAIVKTGFGLPDSLDMQKKKNKSFIICSMIIVKFDMFL